MMIHATVLTADAIMVLTIARMAISSNAPSDPQLNPNHPTQRIMAPRNIIGTLCERPLDILLLLFPMATAQATPDIAEHMWTTVPPAKS